MATPILADDGFALREPIAIVGMGCRLPGQVSSPSDLWRVLIESRTTQGPTPATRWNKDAFFHPATDHPGTFVQREGHYIDGDIYAFDNAFFGINNREAESMDPQQRNLLEVTYEALESGGIRLEDISGSNVGVYVANFALDGAMIAAKDLDYANRHTATGAGITLLSNRISHIFNLSGPSLVIDTACSSSVYGLHFACLALQAGEIDAAIVAGTNLLFAPEQQIFASQMGVISPTGACHWADAAADGYARADGVGALYMKRLDDALKDGDPIRSVIRGSALNCNGRTFGITLPSIKGQEAVIRASYRQAGLALNETDYVEKKCHGTGTQVGDPIEIEALSQVFCSGRQKPLLLGSVKTNFGHSEAASGITSIIKATMILENGTIPPSYGVKNINPKIKTKDWNVKIVTNITPWPTNQSNMPRRISINSFGYGGANAHVVLESAPLDYRGFHPLQKHISEYNHQKQSSSLSDRDLYPQEHKEEPNSNASRTLILPISAMSEQSLSKSVENFAANDLTKYLIADLAHTLGMRRSKLRAKGYCLARQEQLESPKDLDFVVPSGDPGHQTLEAIAFVFSGQGAQWSRMGQELYSENLTFRGSIDEQDRLLKTLPDPPAWTLHDTIFAPEEQSQIHQPERSQPACTALQLALVDTLRSWGVKPAAVVGHSSGEIAAAYAAGHLSALQAIAVSYYRGLAVAENEHHGAMAALPMTLEQVEQAIHTGGFSDSVTVACLNSHYSITVSGPEDNIDALLARLKTQGTPGRKLRTGGQAYHSPAMEKASPRYQELLSNIFKHFEKPLSSEPEAQMISTVTGKAVSSNDTYRPEYWRDNLLCPVNFHGAAEQLMASAAYHFIEIGPHSVMELPLRQISSVLGSRETTHFSYSALLNRGVNSVLSTLKVAGTLFFLGFSVDFNSVNCIQKDQSRRVIIDLPQYPWQHDTTLWSESRLSTEHRFRKYAPDTLLGTLVPGIHRNKWTWRKVFWIKEISWVADHLIDGSIILPAAVYLTMAMRALQQATDSAPSPNATFLLEDIKFLAALAIKPESSQTIDLLTDLVPLERSYVQSSTSWFTFEISSIVDSRETLHATGHICYEVKDIPMSSDGEFVLSSGYYNFMSPTQFYEELSSQGFEYGPNFKSISDIYRLRNENHREIPMVSVLASLPKTLSINSTSDFHGLIHPVMIDSALQCGIIADSVTDPPRLRSGLPMSIGHIRISPEPNLERSLIYARAAQTGFGLMNFDVKMCKENNIPLLTMENVKCPWYMKTSTHENIPEETSIFTIEWKPDISFIQCAFYNHVSVARMINNGRNCHLAEHPKTLEALDLIMHKYPNCSILDFDEPKSTWTEALMDMAALGTSRQRCQSLMIVTSLVKNEIEIFELRQDRKGHRIKQKVPSDSKESLTVLIFHERKPASMENWISLDPSRQQEFVANDHILICDFPNCSAQTIKNDYDIILNTVLGDFLILRSVKAFQDYEVSVSDHQFLILPDTTTKATKELYEEFTKIYAGSVTTLCLSEVTAEILTKESKVFSCVELHVPLLSNINSHQLLCLKLILERAAAMVWLTGGNLLIDPNPDYSMASAFFRTMRLEYFPAKIVVIDTDPNSESSSVICAAAVEVLDRLSQYPTSDEQFVLSDGVLHVSRLVPSRHWNELYSQVQGQSYEVCALDAFSCVTLNIEVPGDFSTLYFKQSLTSDEKLGSDDVRVKIKVVGLNAKDMYTMSSKVHTRNSTCSLDCAGTVVGKGEKVHQFDIGDSVVVMAPGKCSPTEIFPSFACCKLESSDSIIDMATVPIVFSSAIYALETRARLEAGETVLIHLASGGLGQAAVQVAQNIGAEIFATVGTLEKAKFLRDVYGISEDHIFNSRSPSFLEDVMRVTQGRGVDVVLNSLTHDLFDASWKACADFGRFVEVGAGATSGVSRLDLRAFTRGITFTAFDLAELYWAKVPSKRLIWKSLLQESISRIRCGKFRPIKPIKVYDISQVDNAFSHLADRKRIGKVALDFTNPRSIIKSRPPPFRSRLHSSNSYLLIGGLGGVGRSISRWVVERGARHLIFISRSGLDHSAARSLAEELQESGVEIDAVRGSISDHDTIQTALSKVKSSLGGVIHAGMDAKEAMFSELTHEAWNQAMESKVHGTWALHKAIQDREAGLDFFIMTSSLAGSVAQAGESSYCAANSFQDGFARYRRSKGLVANAIAFGVIKGIGYLAEHPEQEILLQKAGYTALSEREVLQLLDLALTNPRGMRNDMGDAHFVTGIHAQTKGRHIRHLMRDPRAVQLQMTMNRQAACDAPHSLGEAEGDEFTSEIQAGIQKKDKKLLISAVVPEIANKFGAIMQTPVDRIQQNTRLSNLGMDSMLAVEARQSATLGINVPMIEFMSQSATVGDIAAKVADGLLRRTDEHGI